MIEVGAKVEDVMKLFQQQEPEKPKEPQNEERSESKYMLPPLTEQQVRWGVWDL
jgi:hypothetical protein